LYEKLLILRRTERDIIENMNWTSRKFPLDFVRF
jgi:hypothetical protein